MNISAIAAVSAGLLLTLDNPKEASANELDKLQGEWVLVETANEKRPDRGDDGVRLIIDGDAVTMTFQGLTTNQGTVQIKFSDQATLIDMKLAEGKTWLGRYELAGDQLTCCFDVAGKDRPTRLTPKGTQWVEKWKRSKP